MPKNNICAFKGCDNSARKRPDLSFHRFPRDDERLKKWIARAGRNEWLQMKTQTLQNHRICSEHFVKSDFIINGRTQCKPALSAHALPTVNTISSHLVESQPLTQPTFLIKLEPCVSIIADVSQSLEEAGEPGVTHRLSPETIKLEPCVFESSEDDAKPHMQLQLSCGEHIKLEPSVIESAVVSQPPEAAKSNLKKQLSWLEQVKLEPCINETAISRLCEETATPHIKQNSELSCGEQVQELCVSVTADVSRWCKELTKPRMKPKSQLSCGEQNKDPCVSETVNVSRWSEKAVKPSVKPKPQLTWREQKLQKKLTRVTSRLKKCRQVIRNLKRRSKKKLSVPDIVEGAAHHIFGDRLLLLKMQLEHLKHTPWSEEEKQFALGLFHKSPKTYVYLRDKKNIALPCVTLVRNWTNLNLTAGISPDILEVFKIRSSTFVECE